MASIFSHVAVPIALRLSLGRGLVSNRLLAAGMFASVAPDFDSLGFRFGVSYGSQWGHRGFTHSLAFALGAGALAVFLSQKLYSRRDIAFFLVVVSMASHGALDALTTGGLGIAFLWPWDHERYFLPWKVIEVSPLHPSRFITARGLEILKSEFIWVWLPVFAASAPFVLRRWLLIRRLNREEGN